MLYRSVFGRHPFAVGKDEEAARYSGIRSGRVIVGAVVSDVIEGPDGSRFVARVAFVEVREAAPQSIREAGDVPFRALAMLIARGGIAGLLAVDG